MLCDHLRFSFPICLYHLVELEQRQGIRYIITTVLDRRHVWGSRDRGSLFPTCHGCPSHQAGSFLKERSAIVRAVCLDIPHLALRQDHDEVWEGCGRGYFAPEPASRTRPRRILLAFPGEHTRPGCSETLFEGAAKGAPWAWLVASPREQLRYSSHCFQSPVL